jgi:hypothetical protein
MSTEPGVSKLGAFTAFTLRQKYLLIFIYRGVYLWEKNFFIFYFLHCLAQKISKSFSNSRKRQNLFQFSITKKNLTIEKFFDIINPKGGIK